MDFTFCVFTYNQANIVVQQLESIKYQIENYGKGITCKFLLSDDNSPDFTVKTIEKWLDLNSTLFDKIDILVNDRNIGLVGNYTQALRNIDTQYFKILAGDDFYYKNNIFEIYKKSNLVISPLIFYSSDGVVEKGAYGFIRRLLCCGNDSQKIKSFILSQYKYGGGLSAPGIFFSREIVNDGLFYALKDYKWIEDAPEFHYFMNQDITNVKVNINPFIVYRSDLGISHKPISQEMLNDSKRLDKTIHIRRRRGNKFLNPFTYLKAIECANILAKGYCKGETRRLVRSFSETMNNERKESINYITEIVNRANDFYSNHI